MRSITWRPHLLAVIKPYPNIISKSQRANIRQRANAESVREGRMFHASLSVPEPHDLLLHIGKSDQSGQHTALYLAVSVVAMTTVSVSADLGKCVALYNAN